MWDHDQLKRRMYLQLLGSPITLVPFVAGLGGLIVAGTLPIEPAIPVFVGVAGLVVAAGSLAIRILTGKEKIAQRALDEMRGEEEQRQRDALDTLHQRLAEDDDPRDENLLSDLRGLLAVFKDGELLRGVNPVLRSDVVIGVQNLFSESIRLLETSLRLRDRAQKLSSAVIREPIEQQRLRLISEVELSLRELGRILADIEQVGHQNVEESALRGIVKDLSRCLEVGKQTRDSLDREFPKSSGRAGNAAQQQRQ